MNATSNIRPAFANFIQKSTGGVTNPTVGEIPVPADSDAEQFAPQVAQSMADYFGTVTTLMPQNQVDQMKQQMGKVLQQHPDAQEALATISEKASPECLPIGYKAGPQPGLFSVEMHEFSIFSPPASGALYGDHKGTLFVDTTPQQEGIQFFFHPQA